LKTKKCIKCGVKLHPTDWIILKEMSTMPICDNCLLSDKENKNESEKDKLNENPLIRFPEKNY
jgi:hypothetical protein